jgi:hypothetical protein
MFPLLHPKRGSLSENLPATFTLGMPPVVFADFETNEILATLKTISFVMDIPTISMADKKAVSKAVYNTEHKLLSMEYAQDDPFAYQECQKSPLSYAFTLAALLYLEVIIREHPYISKVHYRLTSKLHKFLSESSSPWYGIGSLPYRDIHLWIMFVKVVTSPRDLSTKFHSAEDLETEEQTKESLRGRLRRTAWRENICDLHLDRIWRDLKSRKSPC